MVNSSSQAVLVVLFIGCCLLGQNSTRGIIIRDDEYDESPERANNNNNNNPQNFHEVDAFGDDYVDFGAHTGANGAFYWHANFPVEDHDDYSGEDRRRK